VGLSPETFSLEIAQLGACGECINSGNLLESNFAMVFQSMIDADYITTITELAERQDDNHFKALASACLQTKNQYDQYHPRFWLALDALIFQLSKDHSHLDTLEKLLLWSLNLKEESFGEKSFMLSPLLRQLVFFYCIKLDWV